jgi:hypothetical protein
MRETRHISTPVYAPYPFLLSTPDHLNSLVVSVCSFRLFLFHFAIPHAFALALNLDQLRGHEFRLFHFLSFFFHFLPVSFIFLSFSFILLIRMLSQMGARPEAGPAPRPRVPHPVRHRPVRVVHLLHLQRPPPQAEGQRLAGHLRPRRLLHRAPMVGGTGSLRRAHP